MSVAFVDPTMQDGITTDPTLNNKDNLAASLLSLSVLGSPPLSAQMPGSPIHVHSAREVKNDPKSNGLAELDNNMAEKKAAQREKNRLAAAKCRARKRENTEKMNEKSRKMRATSRLLQQQIQILEDELSILRTYVLSHQWCNCGVARYNRTRAFDRDYRIRSVDCTANVSC